MAFRCILIENPARLSVRNEQLLIRTDGEHSIPIEDISALLIENNQTTVTASALSRLGERRCCVYFCDEKHLPCAVLTPFAAHSRELAAVKHQLGMGEVLKKRLWQSVAIAKLRNQANALRYAGCEGAEALEKLAGRVRSGDADGYYMVQYSVYCRICNGTDAVEKHRLRLKGALPDNGAIRMLVITEKQYEKIEVLLGAFSEADDDFQAEQLSIF